MEKTASKYIGRYVRLKEAVFQKIAARKSHAGNLENFFVVAFFTPGLNKFICYGAKTMVTASISEMVMV